MKGFREERPTARVEPVHEEEGQLAVVFAADKNWREGGASAVKCSAAAASIEKDREERILSS